MPPSATSEETAEKKSVEEIAEGRLGGQDLTPLRPPEGRDQLDIFQKVRAAQIIFNVREVQKPPMEWKDIAAGLELSESTCKRLLRAFKQSNATVENPYEIIDRLFAVYEGTIQSMAAREQEMSLNPSPAAANAQVGAARTMLFAAESQIFLLSRMGRLPDQLDALISQEQLMAKVDRIIEALNRNKAMIPPEVIAEIVEAARGDIGPASVVEHRTPTP